MSDLPGEDVGGVSELFNQDLNVRNHDVYERHEYGKAFPIPANPANVVASSGVKPGSSLAPARADHVHGLSPAMQRNCVGYSSPALSSGQIPTLIANGILVPASLVTVPSVQYSRFATISASAACFFGTTTIYRGEYILLGVRIDGTPVAGSGFGVTPVADTVVPFVRNQYNATYVTANWFGHRELLAGFSWAFQLYVGCTDTTYTVTAGGFRMTIVTHPAFPYG